ncbi:MAG: PVC-type heme-binding CxxCH protein [Verrucomicrobiota bacterium]
MNANSLIAPMFSGLWPFHRRLQLPWLAILTGRLLFFIWAALILPRFSCGAAEAAAQSVWSVIPVPGAWESHPSAKDYDGFAWYRTWFKPHDSFFTPHERNLFAESVTINIRNLADAHEVFVNATRIGGGGQFPPQFASGRTGNHRHKVPPGLLRKGEWNEIAIRVFNRSGPGGFLGEAPFIMDYFMECIFEGAWEFRLGDDASWAGKALSARPERSAFDRYHESNRTLGEAEQFVHGEKLSPEDSLNKLRPHAELTVETLLSEPLVAQPVHLSFDERGRLWIAQYRQYPYPAGLKMVSRDKYFRSHYDRVPPAPPHHDRGRDVVSIHEDSDGDGRFDRHKIFQEGLNMANASLHGRGGVWVMHTPYLLFYPDANFDDVPDGPPQVHLAGFGLEDTHSVANGLVWGLDGWIYGAQGSTTSSRVLRPGLEAPDFPGVPFEGCMIWRYHPDTRAYEIFAEGSGNTFGLELDSEGRLFSGHNGANTRGWHYVQGGIYLKQDVDPGKFGPPRNPFAFGDLPMMRSSQSVQRFSHFFAIAEGTAIPADFAGKLFALDPVHNVVLACERRFRGATFETIDLGPVLSSEDKSVRPVFIVNAPDGALHIADFYEHYIAHGQHYQSQIDPTSGRIYRLRGKNGKLEKDYNLAEKSNAQLIALFDHPNKWHRHTAVRVLAERRDTASIAPLRNLLTHTSAWRGLGALWTLHQMGALTEQDILAALQHSQPAVRMWAVRLAGDIWGVHPGLGLKPKEASTLVPAMPNPVAAAFVEQARREPDVEVRAQLAATSRRLVPTQSWPLLDALLSRDEDIGDPYIPLLCWWTIEHFISSQPDILPEFFRDTSRWPRAVISEHILPRLMRRFAAEGRRQQLLICAEILRLSPSPTQTAQLIKGFEEAFRGRVATGLPDKLVTALAASGKSSLMLRLRQNETAAINEALAIATNIQASLDERLLYLRTLGELRVTTAVPTLLDLLSKEKSPAILRAALASLGSFDEPEIGSKVLALLNQFPSDARVAGMNLVLTRPGWAMAFVQAGAAGRFALSGIPKELVARLLDYPDAAVRQAATKLFPRDSTEGSREFEDRLRSIERALASGPGNPYAGERIYFERCAACHKLFYKGGAVGPDLTQYQRDNLGTMLVSILNPNAEIREGFQGFELETTDGRSLTGFIPDRDGQVLVLRGLDGQDITLRETEIKSRQALSRSLMPEGLLDGLDPQQLRDFFAYLRSSQPFTR